MPTIEDIYHDPELFDKIVKPRADKQTAFLCATTRPFEADWSKISDAAIKRAMDVRWQILAAAPMDRITDEMLIEMCRGSDGENGVPLNLYEWFGYSEQVDRCLKLAYDEDVESEMYESWHVESRWTERRDQKQRDRIRTFFECGGYSGVGFDYFNAVTN